MSTISETEKRRTFGIISHPDAGKTTLTEKLLLFGGAIQSAGAVKSNKIKKSATSDFMEIEKQRGISVATSVMAFNYLNKQINILDTPGHKDFAEDTYRTLTAVDSVIMVIDCANGVEAQTKKLMEVCRMRDTPVIVFINKMDREGKDAFDLLDEIEKSIINSNLGLNPVNNGESLLINIPPLTEERRMELTKLAKSESESAKVSIRNTRKDANNKIKGLDISDDLKSNLEIDSQELTDKYIIKVDEMFTLKEKDILTL